MSDPTPRELAAGSGLSDEELTELALTADPHPRLDPDVVPWRPGDAGALLPSWYMAAPTARRRGAPTRGVIGVVIVTLLVINALGLCVTWGYLTLA